MYVTACNFTKNKLIQRCYSRVLLKWRNYVEHLQQPLLNCIFKCYFSTHVSHRFPWCNLLHEWIIESRVGSYQNVLADHAETFHITSLLNSIWIGGWFSLSLCIPLHGNILLCGNPFYKWMKLDKTNPKLIEL